MGSKSTIEWTDATWNPVRGCTKISPGCQNCYAATFAERWRGIPGHPFEFGFDLRLIPDKLGDPLRWGTAKRIFVNSMSDLFHPGVPDEFIADVGRVMAAADWHTFQVLTKRAERLSDALQGPLQPQAKLPHIWWGVSVEDRKYGLPRVDILRNSNAGVKFLSIEPLLEDLGEFDLTGIDWVIVGGESGPHSRPMPGQWVRNLQTLCHAAKVPFLFKQWGGTQKHLTGRELDGEIYDAYPEIIRAPMPPAAIRHSRLKALGL